MADQRGCVLVPKKVTASRNGNKAVVIFKNYEDVQVVVTGSQN